MLDTETPRYAMCRPGAVCFALWLAARAAAAGGRWGRVAVLAGAAAAFVPARSAGRTPGAQTPCWRAAACLQTAGWLAAGCGLRCSRWGPGAGRWPGLAGIPRPGRR